MASWLPQHKFLQPIEPAAPRRRGRSADPASHVALRCTFNGWWCNEEKERLLVELQGESDLKKRKAIIDRIQTVFYEDVGSVKIGDYFTLDAARRELRGDFRTAPRMYFWNSWLAK